MNKDLEESTEDQIGIVTFKMNSIQKRPGARMVYKDVYESFPLNNKDTIRTYEGSDAVITFNDGTKVKLDENSLIYFDYSNGTPKIDFTEGSIQVSSKNSNIELNSSGKKINMKNGDFKLNKDSKNLSFVVNSGDASISHNGKDVKISESQMAKLNDEGGVTVKDLPFRLLSPPDQHKELTFARADIHFKWIVKTRPDWKYEKGINERFLEISKNKDFSNIVFSEVVNDSKMVSLPPGNYFWRVKQSEDGNFETSEARKLKILQDSEIKAFTPLDNQRFPKTQTSISFAWSKHNISSNYKIIISKDPGFSSIFKEVSLTSNQILVQDLPIGSYYWKVASLPSLEGAVPIYTLPREFTILDSDVVIDQEEEKKDIIEKSMTPNKEKVIIETKKPIVFKWKDIDGTIYYEFKMYNEKSDSKIPVFQTKSKKNEVVVSDYSYLDQGKFFWEVNPVDVNGKKGHPAKGEFEINVEDKLKNLKPEDIKIISPDTIYRVENE